MLTFNKKPAVAQQQAGLENRSRHKKCNQNRYQKQFDRNLLPSPLSYYKTQFSSIKPKAEWVKVHCCFHHDSIPSLSISMIDGHFKCHACGAKGCDVLAFHCLRYGFSFLEAARDLGALS